MPNIKVYSTEHCPYCVTLKEYLKANNISFQELDVTTDLTAQKEMIEKSGQMGVPVADIDGEIVVGFDKERIERILKIKK